MTLTAWQKATGYGRRNLVETAIGRYTVDQATTEHSPIHHPNIRGGGYFH